MNPEEELQEGELNNENNAEGIEVELTKTSSAVWKSKEADLDEEGDGQLTIDVYQTADEILVESPIAGVKPEDLDIAITNESVTIQGQRRRERNIKDEDYFYQECYWGRFSRSVILPQEVDAEKAEAKIKNGVLTVTLPKLNRQKSKKLKVSSSD